MDYVWVFVIIIIASIVKGITGFGFAMMSLPLLLFWYSPTVIIPVLVMCNLFASIMIIFQKKEYRLINKHLRSLVAYGGVFTILGVTTLKTISSDILIVLISAFFVVLSIIYLFNFKYSRRFRKYTYKIAGAVCGFLTGSISIGGPPLALFLNIGKTNNQQFREVFSWFNIVSASIALIGYFLTGLLTLVTLKLSLLFSPILLLGTFFGKRINSLLPSIEFKRITIFLILASSILLLFHAR